MPYSITASGAHDLAAPLLSGVAQYLLSGGGTYAGIYGYIAANANLGRTVFSRKIKVDSAVYDAIISDLQAKGYDTTGSSFSGGIIKMDWSNP